MAEGDAEDRTEAATPRRLQRAREAGQAPLSREAVSAATLGAGLLAFAVAAPSGARQLAAPLAAILRGAGTIDIAAAGPALLRTAALAWMAGAAPIVLAVLAAGLAAALLQTGFMFSLAALRPDLRRIDPVSGLRRLLGLDSLAEALRSVAKIAVVGFAVWRVAASGMPLLADAPRWSAETLLAETRGRMLGVATAVLGAQAAIAAIDVLWVRMRHARGLRMSREEIREETKEMEGDPRIKARIRHIRTLRARRRMMAAVPKATVVITNPTHYAVALAYDRARNAAPRVVAKGVDAVAERIRDVAMANRVPIVANPPLARALYTVDLDTDIPAEHFRAVAEIIAYVWRLAGRAGAAGRVA
ncbi:MAG: flagellar biosynthesis protein FlhB [Proteobacteria bacterium]|nr:flagellar biosynthesis protein FlhB [Pseudomonadota bacterium]